MTPRRVLGLAGLLVVLAAPAAAAQAALVDEAADAISQDGFYVEPGAEAVDAGGLSDVTADRDLSVAVLATTPSQGERRFADDLVAEVLGTVVVVSDAALEVSSDTYDNQQVDRALDAADARVGSSSDLAPYLDAFASTLRAGDDGSGSGGGSGGGGVGVGAVLLLGGAAVVGVMSLVGRARRSRQTAAAVERSLAEARREVAAQVGDAADRILALNDRVTVAGDEETSRLFAEASSTYSDVQSRLEAATTVQQLEAVSDRLDHARWQFESVAARLDGREPPPQPERETACFFDPTHGAGTHAASLETPAGQREVQVCGYCAGKLEDGEAPQPRMVDVGGRQIPVALAPRHYGGGGLGGLGDIALVLGGRRTPFGWGQYGGGWGGGYGGGWGGGYGAPRRSGWGGGWGGGGLGGSRSRSGGFGGGFGGGVRSGGGGRSRSGGGVRRGGGGRRR